MTAKPIILFDGICNLCNRFVQFVIARDPAAEFQFASLQSAAGAEILARHQLSEGHLSSLVLSIGDRVYTKSDAALRVIRRLPDFWGLAGYLLFLPKFIRDPVYDLIARYRYQWFGRKDACPIPTPELRQRFL